MLRCANVQDTNTENDPHCEVEEIFCPVKLFEMKLTDGFTIEGETIPDVSSIMVSFNNYSMQSIFMYLKICLEYIIILMKGSVEFKDG